MSELIDVLNEKGNFSGEVKERWLIHREGDWHRTVHVWLFHEGDLLLQLRGPQQESNPGLWDISCAGHLGTGESAKEGLFREFEEELGLKIGARKISFLGEIPSVWSSGEFLDREFNAIFCVNWEGGRPMIRFQKEEIEEVCWVPWRDLKKRVLGNDPSLVSHSEEFHLLFAHLEALETCKNKVEL